MFIINNGSTIVKEQGEEEGHKGGLDFDDGQREGGAKAFEKETIASE